MGEFGIIGESFGTELPEVEIEERDLASERNAAKFSRTKEFQALKTHLEKRIAYYQTCLPDGRAVSEGQPSVEDWRVANRVIGELNAIILAYQQAGDTVRDATKK